MVETLRSAWNASSDLKDTAHYGATLVTHTNANLAVRWARQLVSRAQEELER